VNFVPGPATDSRKVKESSASGMQAKRRRRRHCPQTESIFNFTDFYPQTANWKKGSPEEEARRDRIELEEGRRDVRNSIRLAKVPPSNRKRSIHARVPRARTTSSARRSSGISVDYSTSTTGSATRAEGVRGGRGVRRSSLKSSLSKKKKKRSMTRGRMRWGNVRCSFRRQRCDTNTGRVRDDESSKEPFVIVINSKRGTRIVLFSSRLDNYQR